MGELLVKPEIIRQIEGAHSVAHPLLALDFSEDKFWERLIELTRVTTAKTDVNGEFTEFTLSNVPSGTFIIAAGYQSGLNVIRWAKETTVNDQAKREDLFNENGQLFTQTLKHPIGE